VSLTLDPERIEALITPETGAILAVDIYGNPCHAKRLREIADKYGLPLIQDCAQSLGAEYAGRPSGSLADISVFSFSPGKPATAGGGAVLSTPHEDIYDRLVWLTQHPYRQLRDVPEKLANEWGLNLRLAASLARRLADNFRPALDVIRHHRAYMADVAEIIDRKIGLSPARTTDAKPSYYRYTREITSRQERACIEQILREYDIPLEITEPPISRVLYRDEIMRRRLSKIHPVCPVAEAQVRNRVWLRLI
jgi:dTDP-4-amino-4,6-dideoxygalactose transaminase